LLLIVRVIIGVYFQQYLVVAVNFIDGRNRITRRIHTTELPQVNDKLYHIKLYGDFVNDIFNTRVYQNQIGRWSIYR
jgi:hypothetical protein